MDQISKIKRGNAASAPSVAEMDEGMGVGSASSITREGHAAQRSISSIAPGSTSSTPTRSFRSLSVSWDKQNATTAHLEEVFVGKVEFGKPHGYGELTYAAHDPLGRKSYKGAFAEGLKHGRGFMKWTDGRSYDGAWQNDQMHGLGKEVMAGGREYFGNFDANTPHGKGRMTWPNGDYYVGQFVHGTIEGQGKEQRMRTTRHGEFKNGSLWNGTSTSAFEGRFVNGVKEGPSICAILCCCLVKD